MMAEQPERRTHDVARIIDHTLLKPDATREQIDRLCAEALHYRFKSVCVNPIWVAYCAERLAQAPDVLVCSVIGFPLGATLTEVKVLEAERVIANGAREVDMVMNIGALKSGDHDAVERDILAVVEVAHAHDARCKVILETGLLTPEQIQAACQIAQAAGADFVKTSTGFGPGGATVADVVLMRRTVGPEMGVKASGGVRTYVDVQALVAAGATRIGASAGVRIVEEALGQAPGGEPPAAY